MSTLSSTLNQRAYNLSQKISRQTRELRISVHDDGVGAVLMDFGVEATGGLSAGIMLARVCLADLAAVDIVPGQPEIWPGPAVVVRTDRPIEACLGAQYAGWQIASDNFFAMGSRGRSGPLRLPDLLA